MQEAWPADITMNLPQVNNTTVVRQRTLCTAVGGEGIKKKKLPSFPREEEEEEEESQKASEEGRG